MPRQLRPRATSSLAIAPLAVSDLTSAATVGLERWQFLELVRVARIPHVRHGQRTIVLVEDLVDALRSLGREQRDEAPAELAPAKVSQPTGVTADAILARIGRVRTGGAR